MTSSQSAVRVGSQRPRLEHVPEGVRTSGDDVIDVAALAGIELDPWQEYVVRRAMREDESGKWSAFEVALIVARQNGKNIIIEARELAGALLLGEKTIVHSAHEAATALDAFRKLKARIQSTPALLKRIRGYRPDIEDLDSIPGFRLSNQDRGFEFTNGAKISYKTRTAGSGRGLSGDLVILDEAYALTAQQMDALRPTMAARSLHGNPQMWITSSAGLLHSDVLAGYRDRGMTGEGADQLAYFEWSASESAESSDEEAWYQANPALGIHISEDYVRSEYASFTAGKHEGGEEGFRRERLSIWETPENQAFITEKTLEASTKPAEEVEDIEVLAFGVDVSPKRDIASIALAGYMPNGDIGVTLVDRREGSSWLPGRIGELKAAWDPVGVGGLHGSPVEDLLPMTRRAGVRMHMVAWKKYAQACGRFYEMLETGKLWHSGQEEVCEAFANVTPRGSRDGLWVWSRMKKFEDITPVVAMTIAVDTLQAKGEKALAGKSGSKGARVIAWG